TCGTVSSRSASAPRTSPPVWRRPPSRRTSRAGRRRGVPTRITCGRPRPPPGPGTMVGMLFDLDRIGAGLPVARTIDQLPGLLDRTLVVQAPPGTGKTTLVPPALANHT